MKKGVILSLALASLVLVGCNDKGAGQSAATAQEQTAATHQTAPAQQPSAKAVNEVSKKGAEVKEQAPAAKEETTAAKEALEETAQQVKEAATAAAQEAKEEAREAIQSVQKSAESVKEAAAAATQSAAAAVDGAKLFASKCASCHGVHGERKALGKSAVIAGMPKEEVLQKLKGYKEGTLNLYGMGPLMKGQVASLSDAELEALAEYISSLK